MFSWNTLLILGSCPYQSLFDFLTVISRLGCSYMNRWKSSVSITEVLTVRKDRHTLTYIRRDFKWKYMHKRYSNFIAKVEKRSSAMHGRRFHAGVDDSAEQHDNCKLCRKRDLSGCVQLERKWWWFLSFAMPR